MPEKPSVGLLIIYSKLLLTRTQFMFRHSKFSPPFSLHFCKFLLVIITIYIKSDGYDSGFLKVGDANKDHACWERPEDMDTPRTVVKIDKNTPGSDVAGETAAALAAASLVFRRSDPTYSKLLVRRATRVKRKSFYLYSITTAKITFSLSHYLIFKVQQQTLDFI